MRENELEYAGLSFYLDELRRGSTDPYIAYRVLEKSWFVSRKDTPLLRSATVRLIESDPWFLATVMPYSLNALEVEDLERLTPFVGAGAAPGAMATLRAILWYYGRGGPYHSDRAGRAMLKRALGFLQQVPAEQRDATWHEMLVTCYRTLDYSEYKRAFPK